ncbi:MAG: alpha/beta hydrolase [Dehalococcoidia bacterium]
MPFATNNDVRLFYTDSGKGASPRGARPLLFVHGWCCDHTHWQRQVAAFRRKHRVVTVDLRGHGRSSKPRQEYDLPGFCRDLEWLIGKLRLRNPVVVGHSMGGVITLHLAARRRVALSGAVFVDAPIFLHMTPEIRRALRASLAAFTTPAYHEAAAAIIDQFMFRPTSPPALQARLRERMLRTPQHVLEPAWRNIFIDHTSAARRVRVPALAVNAGPGPADYGRLQQLIPHMQLGLTVGAGHFLQLEAPEQLNPMLSTFIGQIGAAA